MDPQSLFSVENITCTHDRARRQSTVHALQTPAVYLVIILLLIQIYRSICVHIKRYWCSLNSRTVVFGKVTASQSDTDFNTTLLIVGVYITSILRERERLYIFSQLQTKVTSYTKAIKKF